MNWKCLPPVSIKLTNHYGKPIISAMKMVQEYLEIQLEFARRLIE